MRLPLRKNVITVSMGTVDLSAGYSITQEIFYLEHYYCKIRKASP